MASSFSYEKSQDLKTNFESQQHTQIELEDESLEGGPEGIAVVGYSMEFPQDATSSEGFWKMMVEKRCAMTEFPPDRLNIDAFYHPDANRGDSFSFRGGHFITKDLAAFDANFFSITPSEAAGMDPAHRRLLETSYKAFENAGIPMEKLSGSNTSVHTACFTDDYKQQLLKDVSQVPKYSSTGTSMAMLANRLSWFFNLTGQSYNVDTACSSSVLGIDHACQLLRNNDCAMSIVAGCNVSYMPEFPNLLSKMSFLSPDSRCYSFDSRANGYARGEGFAVLVLKRISDAIRDSDTIRAVIRSSGSNQDGFTPGITQPSSHMQEQLIRQTYQKAGLSMKHTRFFEAHGTGTAIGDPIESRAIGKAFRECRTSKAPLLVGSVKSNIGHLEAASGLSGLIKSILMLETGIILPSSDNLQQLNPKIDTDYLRISFPTKCLEWPVEGIRRISLNSFGFGGSNCHLVVDDALHYLKLRGLRGNHRTVARVAHNALLYTDLKYLTRQETSNARKLPGISKSPTRHPKLMVWSGSDKASVLRLTESYEGLLERLPDATENTIDDIAYTLDSRRTTLRWKSFAVITSLSDFENLAEKTSAPLASKLVLPRLGFVFTGQGAQWHDMGRELLAYSTFWESVQQSDIYLAELGCPWSVESEFKQSKQDSRVNRPEFSQTMTTVLQIALVDFLESLNITPSAVAGHSSGEIAAAYCSGALSKRSAIRVAYFRGLISASLLQTSKVRGGMLSVGLSAQNVQPYIDIFLQSQLSLQIACFNSPRNVTISGEEETLEILQKILEKNSVFARKLQVPLAYHSSQMQAAADNYFYMLGDLSTSGKKAYTIMVSSVTGKVIPHDQLCEPDYWVQNLVSPVRFSDALATLCRDSSAALTKKLDGSHKSAAVVDHLVEIGPHSALRGPIQETLASLPRGAQLGYSYTHQQARSVSKTILGLAGELYCLGIPLNLRQLNEPLTPESDTRMVLPNLPEYPFDLSQRYWHESRLSKDYRLRKFGYNELLGTPSNDWNPLDARWHHLIRSKEMHWVDDHRISGATVYPGAGVLVMAIEASKQLAAPDKVISGFNFRNVKFQQALSIGPDGTEVSFSMIKKQVEVPQTDAYDFAVFAIIHDQWIQTSTGEIQLRYDLPENSDVSNEQGDELAYYQNLGTSRRKLCGNTVDDATMYEYLHNHGLNYGPAFQAMKHVSWGSERTAISAIQLFRSPLKRIPSEEYTVHPITLDAVLHTIFPAISLGGTRNMSTHVPVAIKNIWISNNGLSYPEKSTIQCFTDIHTETPQSTTSSLFALSEDNSTLLVAGDGLRTSSVGETQSHEADFASADPGWMREENFPDVGLLTAPETEKLLSQYSSPLSKAKRCLSCLAKKFGSTRILCIGSFSSEISRSLLDPFRANTGNSIEITDSSSSRLSSLREAFQDYPIDIKYQLLNIQSDLKEQGFEESTYDIIIIAQFPEIDPLGHAIEHNIRHLLKTGGVIMAYLESKPKDSGITNGSFEVGKESPVVKLFKEVKDLEVILDTGANEDGESSTATLLSTTNFDRNVAPLLLIANKLSDKQMDLASSLSQQFRQFGNSDIHITTLEDSVRHKNISTANCVVLLEYDYPFLEDLNADDHLAMRNLISSSKNILWVSGGGGLAPSSPGFGLINGFSRAMRVEFENLKLVTLALEPGSAINSHAAKITQLIRKSFTGSEQAFYERELTEIDGILYFRRINDDLSLGASVSAHSLSIKEEIQSLADRPRFSLSIPAPGTPDTLKFIQGDGATTSLEPDLVEVDVKAIGLGVMDDLVVSGKDNGNGIGIEGSGVIVKTGTDIDLQLGDRVCFIGHDLFRSNVRLHRQFVAKIPNSMSFSDAATLPSDYTMAFYIVHEILRPTKEDTILLHDPDSTFGRAIIQLLAVIGVSIFTTSGIAKQGRTLSKLSFSDQSNVVSVASSINELMQAANGKGIKAAIGPAGEISSSVSFIESFGHLIAVKPPGDTQIYDFSLSEIPSNVSFRMLDWMSVIQHSLSSSRYSLQNIIDSYGQHLEMHRESGAVFAVPRIQEALKSLRGPTPHKKVVVEFDSNDSITIMRNNIPKYSFDPNASYLIAGGLGGLGRSLSRWMVSRGAKYLILLSTRGPRTDAARELIRELTEQGVSVTTPACDVTNSDTVQRVIQECGPRPIKGCVQASMVTYDIIYEKMTWEDWRKVTNPKVQGSWNLHLALPKNMDFFIMTSSISSVVGLISQVNYGASNTYLDALARFRVANGEKAVALNLGLLGEEGFLSETEPHKLDRLVRTGYYTALSRNDTLAIFDYYCNPDLGLLPLSDCQPIVGIRTPTEIVGSGRQLPPAMTQPLWNSFPLNASSAVEGSATDIGLSEMVKNAASPAEVAEIVGEALMKQLSHILAMPVENIELHKPVFSYGVDSLTAVELRNWISKSFQTEVAVFDIMGGATFAMIGNTVAKKN